MKRVLPVILLLLSFFACRSSYNEEAVQKLINQPGVVAWTDTFVNNSNLITTRHHEVMVVSSKELPNNEVNAIKNYLSEKHNAKVHYYYHPDAYQ